MRDGNDGKPWSEVDEADLISTIERGDSIEEAAIFLCRSGTTADVAAKAMALGLREVEPMPKAR
jgi:hypothetical protein